MPLSLPSNEAATSRQPAQEGQLLGCLSQCHGTSRMDCRQVRCHGISVDDYFVQPTRAESQPPRSPVFRTPQALPAGFRRRTVRPRQGSPPVPAAQASAAAAPPAGCTSHLRMRSPISTNAQSVNSTACTLCSWPKGACRSFRGASTTSICWKSTPSTRGKRLSSSCGLTGGPPGSQAGPGSRSRGSQPRTC